MWWKKAVLLPWVLSLPFVYSGLADDGAGGVPRAGAGDYRPVAVR